MVHVNEDIFAKGINNPLTKQSIDIRRFTISNDTKMSVQVITYGATITSIKVPDANNRIEDIVLGFDTIQGYLGANNPYFGATIGRVCNRIAHGRFELEGHMLNVSRNRNNHHLHGGFIGFDKIVWDVTSVRKDGVSMCHINPDGHEGYPGELRVLVHFTLTEDNCLHIIMEAETNKVTICNLTNHSYFNLAGHDTGRNSIYEHTIQIFASRYTETDDESIPTGRYQDVKTTLYDLRLLGNLGEHLKKLLPIRGFDDNFCVDQIQPNALTMIAKVVHEPSGRWLEIAANQPGVQFYTSNYLPDIENGDEPILGKNGAKYSKHGAICLETQKYPDAPNHGNFPSIILKPNERYYHEVIYKFGICRKDGCKV